GEIVSINEEFATVKLFKGEHCKGCKGCDAHGVRDMTVVAENDIQAQVGDSVIIEISPRHIIGYSFLIFIFPVFCMIAGYFAGHLFDREGEIIGAAGAFIALIFALIIIRLTDKLFGSKNSNIVRISRFVK
ncbi:SoxR reducing system RseC family protein, partial [candidate division KSB1 bacterium]|nr:SoxR reducing system RseC family protein [candidate division KSB1 bacterium]